MKAKRYLKDCEVEDEALSAIINLSSGDLRSAINLLEVCYYGSRDKHISLEVVKSVNAKAVFFSDNNEDAHYDVL